MRGKYSMINTGIAFLLQIVTIVCGFLVPKLILTTYGSSVNGTVSSISQFLGYIVLFEGGMGGVLKSALYKPLAKRNVGELSCILKAADHFFQKLAQIFFLYMILLAILYPYFVKNEFDWFFTASLIFIIGISTLVQYYFGVTYQILLQADQKTWVVSAVQVVSLIGNTILTIQLMAAGFSIQVVKLVSSCIFILRPFFIQWYVKKHYTIYKNCNADPNALKQKWDGLWHHIAYFIHTNTDIVVITFFMNIKEVSVYSVYYLIVSSIQRVISSLSSGISASLGDMIAKGEKSILMETFQIYELINFMLTTVLFSVTAAMLIPFVRIYTLGVKDVSYIRPVFGYWFAAAEACYCVRNPYSDIVFCAGHFKETKKGAMAEALMNIVLSVLLAANFGLAGVAAGTFFSMLLRTMQYVFYLSNHILERSVFLFWKCLMVHLAGSGIILGAVFLFGNDQPTNLLSWFCNACIILAGSCIVIISWDRIFYRKEMDEIGRRVWRFVRREHV